MSAEENPQSNNNIILNAIKQVIFVSLEKIVLFLFDYFSFLFLFSI